MGKWPNRRCIQNQIMMEADHVNVGRRQQKGGAAGGERSVFSKAGLGSLRLGLH